MLFLHHDVHTVHSVIVSEGEMGVSGLRRERKTQNVSEPYIM